MLKQIARCGTVSLLVFASSTLSLAQSSGADTYKAKCQMCHAADGSGNTPAGKAMKAAPFRFARHSEGVGRHSNGRH